MRSSNRVARNTGFLYAKMLITMIISLYSTRLILNALGATHYGIFNLIAGVISMLSFLNAAMTISTQRYLSFYLGAGDTERLKAIFKSSVILHLFIGVSIVLLLEVGGLFLFNGILNIPSDRIGIAKIVFHFMVISTFFTINAVPYDAAIVTHEDFLFDSLVGISESILKLGIAIWLTYADIDKLVLYGLLMAILTILIRLIKSGFCFRYYKECNLFRQTHINLGLIKEMSSFAGWNLFGSFCTIISSQGLAILLNLFFGIIVNAAYALSNQVASHLISFSVNMLRSLNPQIIKSEGTGDRQRMLRLSMVACKLSFLLLAIFAIPLIIEMSFVLKLWLREVPEYTIVFCRLTLISALIQLLTYGLVTALQSVGIIKVYQIVVGSFLIFNLPFAYLLLKLGFPPYSVFLSSIFLELLAGGSRIWFAYKITGLPVILFIKETIVKSIMTVVFAFSFSLIPYLLLEEGFVRLSITITISTLVFLYIIISFALTSYENDKIKELFQSFLKKFKIYQN